MEQLHGRWVRMFLLMHQYVQSLVSMHMIKLPNCDKSMGHLSSISIIFLQCINCYDS